jgi:hypothetical protein
MKSADRAGRRPADNSQPGRVTPGRPLRSRLGRGALAATATGALALAGLSLAAPAGAASLNPAAGHGFSFQTLNNSRDLTFNQLLGINSEGAIAGYFGSGAAGHPNKGYVLLPPHHAGNYISENFPHSAQTQVTGLNSVGNTVGFWVNGGGANFGFYTQGTHFHEVNFPTSHNAHPQVDQLLGINDQGVAVGFFTNAAGANRGYEFNIHTHTFSQVLKPGALRNGAGPSLTAAGINNSGTVAGFYDTKGGVTDGFVKAGHHFVTLAVPGASMTQAFGISDSGEVVGAYTVGSGSSAASHGFIWTAGHGFRTVNDPKGTSTTLINGVNARGELVGFYTDGAGNTDGFLATPRP